MPAELKRLLNRDTIYKNVIHPQSVFTCIFIEKGNIVLFCFEAGSNNNTIGFKYYK